MKIKIATLFFFFILCSQAIQFLSAEAPFPTKPAQHYKLLVKNSNQQHKNESNTTVEGNSEHHDVQIRNEFRESEKSHFNIFEKKATIYGGANMLHHRPAKSAACCILMTPFSLVAVAVIGLALVSASLV